MTVDYPDIKASSAELSAMIGARPKEIDNWLQRPDLMARFKSTRSGARRSISYHNAIELAFMAAFIRVGLKSSQAIPLAGQYSLRARQGVLKEWMIFEPNDDLAVGETMDYLPSLETLAVRAGSARPPAVILLNVGELLRRVQNVFTTGLVQKELKRG